MKFKIGILLILVLFISASANAQFSRFGIKAGVNFSNMSVDNANDKNLRTGFHAGVFGRMAMSELFSLQPELLYTTKGFSNSYDNLIAKGKADVNLNYIEVPINLVYHLSEDFNFQLGPYFSYLANVNVTTNNELLGFLDINTDDNIDRDNFKKFDVGLTAGLGFEVEDFIFGFKYNLGLVNVAENNFPAEQLLGESHHSVIQVYAGILF